MAERRLPFAVRDDEGVQRLGEVVIVPAWRDDIQPSADAAFTIVLAQRPLENGARVESDALALCAPASPTRLPTSVGEARVAYDTTNGDTTEAPLRLPRRTLEAFADGTIVAGRPLIVSAHDIFSGDGRARLETLALALLTALRTADRYWEALDAVLSWPEATSRLARPSTLRARLRRLLSKAEPKPFAKDALERLARISEDAEPQVVALSPGALAEDVALVRCSPEHAAAAEELSRLLQYLDDAVPAPWQSDLVVDRASTRERLSFVTLLSEPGSLPALRATFDAYRAAYAAAYVEHHASYWRASAKLGATLAAVRPLAQALARLNTLQALGKPLGRNALKAYERLRSDVARCEDKNLAEALRRQPHCPSCSLTLDRSPPTETAEQIVRRLSEALARQQARLASEAIRRILTRGGERIEQFLQIVQASDQAGLARVLDDDLLVFLQDLLAQPVTLTTDALRLIDGLARAHPNVRPDDIDAAADTLRALLREQADSQGEVRLATPPT